MGLDAVELVIAIEEGFGIHITDAEAGQLSTPRKLIDYLWDRHERGDLFREPLPPPGLISKLRLIPPRRYALNGVVTDRESLAIEVRHIIRDQTGVKRFSDDDEFIRDMKID
jgi:acyl carrier protein